MQDYSTLLSPASRNNNNNNTKAISIPISVANYKFQNGEKKQIPEFKSSFFLIARVLLMSVIYRAPGPLRLIEAVVSGGLDLLLLLHLAAAPIHRRVQVEHVGARLSPATSGRVILVGRQALVVVLAGGYGPEEYHTRP